VFHCARERFLGIAAICGLGLAAYAKVEITAAIATAFTWALWLALAVSGSAVASLAVIVTRRVTEGRAAMRCADGACLTCDRGCQVRQVELGPAYVPVWDGPLPLPRPQVRAGARPAPAQVRADAHADTRDMITRTGARAPAQPGARGQGVRPGGSPRSDAVSWPDSPALGVSGVTAVSSQASGVSEPCQVPVAEPASDMVPDIAVLSERVTAGQDGGDGCQVASAGGWPDGEVVNA